MKKIVCLTLSLAVAAALAACGSAEAPQQAEVPGDSTEEKRGTAVVSNLRPSEGLEFESNGDGTCTLVGMGICKETDLVIPTESPEGDQVTLIGEYAFADLEGVSSVTLLNYAHEVDERAFQYGEMTAVQVIGGAPVIGGSAFSACEKLETITFQDCALTLEEHAFFGCGKDAAVTFSGCTGTVDKYAFQYGGLLSLTIEDSDLSVEKSAFSSCEDLVSISARDSSLTVEEYAFLSAGDGAEVTMRDCSLVLDDWAFQYASLGQLTITGEGVEMGKGAFSYCEDLTSVQIDCPAVTLGEYAFSGCEDLTTVSICDNGKKSNTISIDDGAFQYCGSLSSVTVGKGAVEIGEYVFSGCAAALEVSVAGKGYLI